MVVPDLILIRGLPGSGKSTMAAAMTNYVHLEADQFFVNDGLYRYDPANIGLAHSWCRARMRKALLEGCNVVVSNTFSRFCEMAAYLAIAKELGISVKIIEANGTWPNVHGVPDERIQQMQQRWEHVPGAYPVEVTGDQ